MKKIDDLAAVIAPPDNPRITISSENWLSIFAHFGTRLPQDFVEFHNRYGEGYFYSLSHKWSANLEVYGRDFYYKAPKRLTELRLVKEKRPKRMPLPLYWEPNGLLPWGRTTNDVDLCWRVTGDLVDGWPVTLVRSASGGVEEYNLTMSEFLREAINGGIQSDLLPKGFPGEKGVSFEIFRH